MFKVMLLCAGAVALALPAGAKPATGRVRVYDLSEDIKTVRVQVQNAHILVRNFTQPKKSKRGLKQSKQKIRLKIQYSKELSKEEKDSVLIISERNFPDKKSAWKPIGKPPVMTVWAPSTVSLETAIFGGRVEVNKFRGAGLSVFMASRGSVLVKNSTGGLNVFQSAGDIKILSHKGNITIQAEDSRVSVNSCKGHIDISSFKGRVEANGSSGRLSFRAFKSPLIVNKFTGRLDFQQEKGGIYLKPMIGSAFGYSKEGEVRGALHAGEAEIETKTGRIHLDIPYSRAWVTAQTWEGKIFTPVYFNRIKTGGVDRAKGRLRGSKRKGNVSLKSHAGSIRVYQSAR